MMKTVLFLLAVWCVLGLVALFQPAPQTPLAGRATPKELPAHLLPVAVAAEAGSPPSADLSTRALDVF